MHSGFQIVLQNRLAELREVANSVVSGTRRERFDALCAHMKKGENRHESFKGVRLRNPETGDQYKWKSSMGAAELWAAPLVGGLINQDRGGIDLEDVCKLLDSALPFCNTGTLSKGDMFVNTLKHYVYNIEFPENFTLIVAIMINITEVNEQVVITECKAIFQVSIYYVEYKCFVDEAVTDFAEVLQSLVRTNPENDTPTVTFWDAFITFSNKCTLLSPDKTEGRQMVRLFRFMLKLLVYYQNYPFFFGEAKGHNAKVEPVFFRASFVDKCLAP